MTSLTPSTSAEPSAPIGSEEHGRFVGVFTRMVSWMLDAVVINAVAIGTGLGVELILSIFPVSPSFASVLKPIAGVAYVVWTGGYFVVLWWWTGQTLGARVMQIRLVAAKRGRVKPARAVVRWVGMNLAMVPLFAGFVPILFGRRGFPDWLAGTVVLEAEQPSLIDLRRAKARAAIDAAGQPPPGPSIGSERSPAASRDGGVPPLGMHRDLP